MELRDRPEMNMFTDNKIPQQKKINYYLLFRKRNNMNCQDCPSYASFNLFMFDKMYLKFKL